MQPENEIPSSDQILITKRSLLIIAAVTALAFVIIIAAGVALYLKVEGESTARSAANRNRIRDIKVLMKPTPKQYRKQLRVGIKNCTREPLCVKALRKLLRRHPTSRAQRSAPGTDIRRGSRLDGSPGVDANRPETDEGAGPPSDRSRPRGPPSRDPAPPPSPGQPPGNGRGPPIQVTIPGGPQLCGELVALNC